MSVREGITFATGLKVFDEIGLREDEHRCAEDRQREAAFEQGRQGHDRERNCIGVKGGKVYMIAAVIVMRIQVLNK